MQISYSFILSLFLLYIHSFSGIAQEDSNITVTQTTPNNTDHDSKPTNISILATSNKTHDLLNTTTSELAEKNTTHETLSTESKNTTNEETQNPTLEQPEQKKPQANQNQSTEKLIVTDQPKPEKEDHPTEPPKKPTTPVLRPTFNVSPSSEDSSSSFIFICAVGIIGFAAWKKRDSLVGKGRRDRGSTTPKRHEAGKYEPVPVESSNDDWDDWGSDNPISDSEIRSRRRPENEEDTSSMTPFTTAAANAVTPPPAAPVTQNSDLFSEFGLSAAVEKPATKTPTAVSSPNLNPFAINSDDDELGDMMDGDGWDDDFEDEI